MAGIVFEAVRLVMVQRILSAPEFKMDPLVSLYYYAPACAAINGVITLFVEVPKMGMGDIYNVGIITLLLNAAVAFGLNVSVVFLVSYDSAEHLETYADIDRSAKPLPSFLLSPVSSRISCSSWLQWSSSRILSHLCSSSDTPSHSAVLSGTSWVLMASRTAFGIPSLHSHKCSRTILLGLKDWFLPLSLSAVSLSFTHYSHHYWASSSRLLIRDERVFDLEMISNHSCGS